jgi:hypothetical protein
MIAMASIGAFSGALTGNAQRISQERKDGWIRQLRLTSLPANAYVLAKVIASMVTTVPSVVIVLALGRFYGGVHLAAWKWLAIAGVIWLGALTFAALAVALGYRFMPDTVQPVAMFVGWPSRPCGVSAGRTGSQRARRKVVRPLAMARAALACQARDVTRAASVALRMLAHSMNTLGTVDRLIPPRSSRGWIPSTPS